MKVGDKAFVPSSLNPVWTGNGEVINLQFGGYVVLKMLDGGMVGKRGYFESSKLECSKLEGSKLQIEGGSPHGFGVWVDGKFHPVNIGALGKIITDLQAEVAELKKAQAVSNEPYRVGFLRTTLVNIHNIAALKSMTETRMLLIASLVERTLEQTK